MCKQCEIVLEVALTFSQIKVEYVYGLLQGVRGEEIGWLPLQDGFGLGSARLKDWDTQVRGEPEVGVGGNKTMMIDSSFGATRRLGCMRKVFAAGGGREGRCFWSEPQTTDVGC